MVKKTTTIAAALAAALMLAGCGSDSDGTAATTAPSAAPTSAEATTPATTAMTMTSEDEQTTSAEETTEASTAAEPTQESSTDAGSSGFDEQTTVWFETFCGSMIPPSELQEVMSGIDQSDPKGALTEIGALVTRAGNGFTDGAAELSALPPPTFDGGDEFAADSIAAFEELGPKFLDLGEKLASIDPTDPAAVQELSTLPQELQAAGDPIKEVGTLAPEVQAAAIQVPACAEMAG